MGKGKLVVIEGIDGSGKSTLVSTLIKTLDAKGKTVAATCFPSRDGFVGAHIRKTFDGSVQINTMTMAYLMLADGADKDPVLRDYLEEFDVVLCDRHPLVSGWAYQGEEIPINVLTGMQQSWCWLPLDLVAILDISPEEAMLRWQARNCGEDNKLFERDDLVYHAGLRNRYAAYALSQPNTMMLDGKAAPDKNASIIAEILENLGV